MPEQVLRAFQADAFQRDAFQQELIPSVLHAEAATAFHAATANTSFHFAEKD